MPLSVPHPGVAALPGGSLQRRRALTFAVWAAALAGTALGADALRTDDRTVATPAADRVAPVPAAGPLRLGDRIPMSFGNASVGSVVRLTGPEVAAGMGLRAGERAYQAQLTVINLSSRPVTFAPSAIAFDGGARNVQVGTGAAEGGRSAGRSPHRFTIRFVAPAAGALPALRVTDPGTGRTRAVALGSAEALKTLDLGELHR